MIKKYQAIMDDVFRYLYNSLEVIEDSEKLANEVINKFPTFVCYFKCDNEMIYEFMYQTIEMIKKTKELTKKGE